MVRPQRPILAAVLVASLPFNGGCALFAVNKMQAQQQEAMADAQRRADEAQREANRQIAIAEARTEFLEEELDAQVYESDCDTLSGSVEKVVIKMGRSLMPPQAGMLVTDWSHVSAAYETDYWAYTVRKTRAASKSRYVVELENEAQGCKVNAVFQYSDDAGRESSDRALDFEARVLEEVDPNKYAGIKDEYEAIENKFPAS